MDSGTDIRKGRLIMSNQDAINILQAVRAFMQYRGEQIEVEVVDTFEGGNGMIASVKTTDGSFPFDGNDIQAQGESCMTNRNGYRVRAEFVKVEPVAVDVAGLVRRDIQQKVMST
jgi:hypothetical protein